MVGELDLIPILPAYSPRGRRACHPKMLLGLLFCGYAKDVFSSQRPPMWSWLHIWQPIEWLLPSIGGTYIRQIATW